MKGGLEIWKTSKPTWVKKSPNSDLPKLNVSKPEYTNRSAISSPMASPNSSPDSSTTSSPATSPKPTIIDVSFAVPKKQNQKEANTARPTNPGSRFNLLPTKQLNTMKWFQ